MKYIYLTTKKTRQEIVKIGNALANYLHDNKIPNIIFLDRSARQGYLALKEAWKILFPGEVRPNIYFTNPEGYNHRGIEEVVNEFNKTYLRLSSDKKSKIMLFDTCMHSGETMESVYKILREAGFTDVVLGLAQPPSYPILRLPPPFLALEDFLEKSCCPFGHDSLVKKEELSILSSSHRNEYIREESIKLRKEILRCFRKKSLCAKVI